MESDFSSVSLEPHLIEDVTVVDVPNTPANPCSSLQQDLSRISAMTDYRKYSHMVVVHVLSHDIFVKHQM